jgi:hypothetical protein
MLAYGQAWGPWARGAPPTVNLGKSRRFFAMREAFARRFDSGTRLFGGMRRSARLSSRRPMRHKAYAPLLIFIASATAYILVLGKLALEPSPNNHFVHLARSFLHGQLSLVGNTPPGTNDWARYEGTWFVSFPAFPAVVILPAVAIWGTATPDRLFWAILAGLAPALLYMLLRELSERGESERSAIDNLTLALLYAFGSVYFFVAVQGTVWFAAHVVASTLIVLYVWFGLSVRRPLWSGLALGLCFLTRTTTALLVVWFVIEALRTHRKPGLVSVPSPSASPPLKALHFVRSADLGRVAITGVIFALPILACIAVQLWMNETRFDDPLTFGHEHLEIRWKGRIEKWGLFSYHYLSKNLAVFLASMPWLSADPPYVKISLHGLALWVTTPGLLWALWPRRWDARMVGLAMAALCVATLNLCYQNSGWVQFGYRFALDYLPLVFVLLALGARRFGPGFYACAMFALVINAFGAFTFGRNNAFYDNDSTQNRLFQPD